MAFQTRQQIGAAIFMQSFDRIVKGCRPGIQTFLDDPVVRSKNLCQNPRPADIFRKALATGRFIAPCIGITKTDNPFH